MEIFKKIIETKYIKKDLMLLKMIYLNQKKVKMLIN